MNSCSNLASQTLSIFASLVHVEGDVLALLLPGDLGHDLQSPVLGHQLLLSQLLNSNKPVLCQFIHSGRRLVPLESPVVLRVELFLGRVPGQRRRAGGVECEHHLQE